MDLQSEYIFFFQGYAHAKYRPFNFKFTVAVDVCINMFSLNLTGGRFENLCARSWYHREHYSDVIMGKMASQITSFTIVYLTIYSSQIKGNIKAPCHWPLCGEFTGDRWPVNSSHKWPVTRKIFPFDDVIMADIVGYNYSSVPLIPTSGTHVLFMVLSVLHFVQSQMC